MPYFAIIIAEELEKDYLKDNLVPLSFFWIPSGPIIDSMPSFVYLIDARLPNTLLEKKSELRFTLSVISLLGAIVPTRLTCL